MKSLRRDLDAITNDGIFFSLMVGLGETYVPAFALAVGLGDVTAGLLATLPMLLGAILQLVTPYAVRRLGSYRRWVVACAQLQALSFLPLIVGTGMGGMSLYWVVGAAVGYWAFGMATGPAWNAWITSVVPAGIRPGFFARRTRAAQAALFLGLLVGGLSLDFGRRNDAELFVFAMIFGGASLSRLASAHYLGAQSEPAGLARSHRTLGLIGVWEHLYGSDSLRVLRYLLAMQVVTYIAAPYFTPYMLSHLELSYGEFMTLTAAAFVARVAILPFLGRTAREHGARRLLWLGGLGIIPLPPLWLVSDAFGWLLCVQLLAGCAWAAVELATTLSFFERIDAADRASVLSVFNLANALAIALGSLIGAQIITHFDASITAYVWLFTVSSAGRLLAASMLRKTPAAEPMQTDVQLRTLAVRPSGVAVQPPILASLGADASDAPHVPRGDPGA